MSAASSMSNESRRTVAIDHVLYNPPLEPTASRDQVQQLLDTKELLAALAYVVERLARREAEREPVENEERWDLVGESRKIRRLLTR